MHDWGTVDLNSESGPYMHEQHRPDLELPPVKTTASGKEIRVSSIVASQVGRTCLIMLQRLDLVA